MERIKLLFVLMALCLCGGAHAQAYHFTVPGVDGVTLYFKIINETTREVALQDKSKPHVHYRYDNLTKLHIPDTVTYNNKKYTVTEVIDASTMGMGKLVDLKLPNTLKHIRVSNNLAFCHALKKLVIPASVIDYVRVMGTRASGIEEVYLYPKVPPVHSLGYTTPAFNSLYASVKVLYVPTDCAAAYKAAPQWQKVDSKNVVDKYREQVILNANGYSSLYLENENFLVPTGCTAYIITGVTPTANSRIYNGVAKKIEAGWVIPAQTGFILKGGANDTVAYEAAVTVPAGKLADVTGNLLVGTATDNVFTGGNSVYYLFGHKGANQAFYHQTGRNGESIALKAHRAGLKIDKSLVGRAKSFVIDFDSAEPVTTAIGRVDAQQPSQQPDVIFDLQGRRVKHPTRGIYIINGKKVVKE